MIASDHPTDRPRPLALSVLIAILASATEVATRVLWAPESFTIQQLAVALSANVAVLGLVAMIAVAIGSILLRPRKNGPAPLRSFFLAAWATPLVLVATSLGDDLSKPALAGLLFVPAVVLPATLGRFVRRGAIRFAIGLAWAICAATTALATTKTVQHLRPWMTPASASTARPEQPNMLVLMLDTLRWDRVGVYSGSKLTPNLDRLAESSIVYTEAISTAPWTLPTHASLFTGLYPHEHHVSWGNYALGEEYPVLAELLKQRGYHTFGVSNNWLVSKDNGFARGFDSFLETPDDPLIHGWRLALRCGGIARLTQWLGLPSGLGDDAGSAWTNWLITRYLAARPAGPFFGFINYFEPHDPYVPPDSYARAHLSPAQRDAFRTFTQRQEDLCAHACGVTGTFTAEQIDLMRVLYDAEVAYQDAMVGQLIDRLAAMKLLDTTWLVVTSDHGELFGESNMVFHTAGSHYQLLHVPLIVRPPGGAMRRTVHAAVQPVDVFRTLLEAGGGLVPVHVRRSQRLPLHDDETAQRTLCVAQTFGASITGLYVTQYRDLQADVSRWLQWVTSVYSDGFMLELDERGPRSLYDVRRDPDMAHDLKDERSELVKTMLEQYQQWLSFAQPGGSM